MASTVYLRPSSLHEAVDGLHEHGFDAKVLAGGQSLIPMISLGLARPNVLVDIGRIPNLDQVERKDGIRIGALVRHRDLLRADDAVAGTAPLLPAAAPHIGHEAIRNRGTFVGSIAHGDPAAEWPAVALALEANVHVLGTNGSRVIPIDQFYLGPMTTTLAEDELVTAVELPTAVPRTGASVLELTYRHGDYAVVGVAAQVTLAADGVPSDVRIGLFGVGATPIRARNAESIALAGPNAFEDAGHAAAAEADPATDATASADYRRDMVAIFVRRALTEAHARAGGVADAPSTNGLR